MTGVEPEALLERGPHSPPRAVAVLSHRRPEQTRASLGRLLEMARAAGVELYFGPEEASKFGLVAGDGIVVAEAAPDEVQLCVVLGGDGTILRALERYAYTPVPVFAVNFGQIGFLATIEPHEIDDGLGLALRGDFDLLRLPAIVIDGDYAPFTAINDVAIHRKVGDRVAELTFALDDETLGTVRCDGLVVATPAGSTGYNLANGGPVMAWGAQGYVVSFIAPHTLTARALVAAPLDVLSVRNRSDCALEVSIDGVPVRELGAGDVLHARFADRVATMAQLPGLSFYRRLRERFGKLA